MLIQFNFKNYKSFKNETTLDFSATRLEELSYHIREMGLEKILPAAIIFGANASGKSNVQEALLYMTNMVLSSLNYGEESKTEKYIRATPFLFDKVSANEPSLFEIYFTSNYDKEKVYNYGFVIDDEGIVEEWLNSKARTARKYKTVFYRDRSELNLVGIPSKYRKNLEISLEEKTLLVSLGARLQVDILKLVFQFFVNVNITNFGEPIENLYLSRVLPAHIDDDENVKKDVINYFSSFDESIVDIKVEMQDRENGEKNIRVDAGHKIENSEEIAYIPLRAESAGTLKMFALYPLAKEVLRTGGVLFVDELNARLHPLLVRTFVQMFLNPEINVNNAQLIMTSHDSWQLNSGTFRKDEIWFTEKQKDGSSQLYSLADFTDESGKLIRNDENFEKNYLLGKYGGIPNMKMFDIDFNGESNAKE